MKIERKTPVKEAPKPSVSKDEMKNVIKKQESIFQKRIDSVDDSKTKSKINKNGDNEISYYDKNGNLLYTQTVVDTGTGKTSSYYTLTDKDGNLVQYSDYDNDGNMDSFSFIDKRNSSKSFQAFDNNDDGTFDEGMANCGKDAGKRTNLNGGFFNRLRNMFS